MGFDYNLIRLVRGCYANMQFNVPVNVSPSPRPSLPKVSRLYALPPSLSSSPLITSRLALIVWFTYACFLLYHLVAPHPQFPMFYMSIIATFSIKPLISFSCSLCRWLCPFLSSLICWDWSPHVAPPQSSLYPLGKSINLSIFVILFNKKSTILIDPPFAIVLGWPRSP